MSSISKALFAGPFAFFLVSDTRMHCMQFLLLCSTYLHWWILGDKGLQCGCGNCVQLFSELVLAICKNCWLASWMFSFTLRRPTTYSFFCAVWCRCDVVMENLSQTSISFCLDLLRASCLLFKFYYLMYRNVYYINNIDLFYMVYWHNRYPTIIL